MKTASKSKNTAFRNIPVLGSPEKILKYDPNRFIAPSGSEDTQDSGADGLAYQYEINVAIRKVRTSMRSPPNRSLVRSKKDVADTLGGLLTANRARHQESSDVSELTDVFNGLAISRPTGRSEFTASKEKITSIQAPSETAADSEDKENATVVAVVPKEPEGKLLTDCKPAAKPEGRLTAEEVVTIKDDVIKNDRIVVQDKIVAETDGDESIGEILSAVSTFGDDSVKDPDYYYTSSYDDDELE